MYFLKRAPQAAQNVVRGHMWPMGRSFPTPDLKYAIQIMSQVNGKSYRRIKLEEHYVIVGETSELYLSHVTPKDRKSRIAQALYATIKGKKLHKTYLYWDCKV